MHVVAQRIEIKANSKFKTYCRKAFGVTRFAYNYGVERFNADYKQYISQMDVYHKVLKQAKDSPLSSNLAVKPKLPSVLDYKKDFNALRKTEYPFTYEVTKYACQQPFINLGRAITSYFKNSKNNRKKANTVEVKKAQKYFPKFKKKSYSRGSFYIGGDQVKLETGVSCSDKVENHSNRLYLHIPRFGYVQLREKLRFDGHINSVTISQRGDRFFASFSFEISDEEFFKTHKGITKSKTSIGIDLGLKNALVLSDGIVIDAPKPLKKYISKLGKQQRQLSRKNHPRTKDDKTKVSKNFIKFSKRVNKLYYRISNIREDYIHKLTTILIRNYEYIALEDLNVRGMMSNHKLARAIADVGFYKIKAELMYKALDFNRTIVQVDRFYPSSKTCCHCGAVKQDLTLKDRVYICSACGKIIDRDLNAAINLRNQIKIGGATPELTPVELTALYEGFNKNQIATSSVESGIR